MKRIMLVLLLAMLVGCRDLDELKNSVQLKELSPTDAGALAAMAFDPGAPVTVHGTVSTLFFGPPGTTGMMVIHSGTQGYVFSTAPTRDLARQGFTRFSMNPGEDVVVTGVLAKGGEKVAGLTAARADSIALQGGGKVFDRQALNLDPAR